MKRFFYCAIMVLICVFIIGFIKISPANANDEVAETSYESVWINDLDYMSSINLKSVYNCITNGIDNVSDGGHIGYYSPFENVEVMTKVKLLDNRGGRLNFHLRSKENDFIIFDGGYNLRWYTDGQFEFLKNFSVVDGYEKQQGPLPAPVVGEEYILTFSTVNLIDGSVKIVAKINDRVLLTYIDKENVILGSGLLVCSVTGCSASFNGEGFAEDAVNLYDVVAPISNANFPDTTNIDSQTGVVTLTSNGGLAGGVGWAYQHTDFLSYKFRFTPEKATGTLCVIIGAQGELRRKEHMDTKGYMLKWCGDNGQRRLYRNGVLIENFSNLLTFTASQTYEIEYGVKQYSSGVNRVHLKINGVLYVNYFDVPSSANEPLTLTKSGTPGSISRWAIVETNGVTGTIAPCTSTANYEQKTLSTSDLGTSVVGGATFDRNGGITNIVQGENACYNVNVKNVAIKFKANFTSVGGGYLCMGLRGKSTDGVTWSNNGYRICLYHNGKVILYKTNIKICEGWSLSSMSMSVDTDYQIEFGTINVTDSAVKVYAKINGAYLINYLDTVDAINSAGWFTLYNDFGYEGKLMPTMEYPTISTDLSIGDNALVGEDINLSYSLSNQSPSDDVEYFVDQDKSTAQATVSGNKLTPTTAGNLVVYAKVNGIYSKDITISVGNPTPFLKNVPETIIFGSANVIIDADMSNNVAVSSKVFGVENASGQAQINEETGEITPIKAGTIKVYATVNGIKTKEKTITIIPVITITNPVKLIKGGEKTLEYTSNCDLPNETITATWEIVSGSDVATIDATTGALNTSKTGTFTVKVTVNAQSFSAESEQLTITVITAELIDLPTEPIIVGGDKWSIDAKMSDDSQVLTKEFGVKDISGSATIDATTGEITPVKAGTIKVYATVNGIKSDECIITLIPKIFINKVDSFAFNGVYDLNEYYEVNCKLPDEEIVVTFELVSGENLVTFDANNGVLTAGNVPGVVGIRVLVTGETFQAISAITYLSIEGVEIDKENLIPTIVAKGRLSINKTQQATVQFNLDDYVCSTVLWSVESGEDILSVSDSGLITALKVGVGTVKVVIDGEYVAMLEIEVVEDISIVGVLADSNVLVGTTLTFSYVVNDANFGEVQTVKYVIDKGCELVSLSESDGKLTALATGKVGIKVIVNGIESTVLNFNIIDNFYEENRQDLSDDEDNSVLSIILGVAGSMALLSSAIVFGVILHRRKMKKRTFID